MSILKNMLMENEEFCNSSSGFAFEKIICSDEIIQANDEFNVISSNTDALESLEAIYAGLEHLFDAVEETDKLTDKDYEFLNRTSDAMLYPLGISSELITGKSPALEDEAESKTSILEKGKEVIKKIWNAIVRTITTMGEKISSWYNNIFKVAKKISDKAKEMLKDVDGLSGKSVKSDKTEIEVSVKHLLSKGQTLANRNASWNNLVKELTVFTKNKEVVSATNAFLSDIKTVEADKNNLGTILIKHFQSIRTIMGLPETLSSKDIPNSMQQEDFAITKFGLLPGNKAIFAYGDKDPNSHSVDKSKYKMGPYQDDGDHTEKIKAGVLTPAELKNSIKEIIETIEYTVFYKERYETIKKLKKTIIKEGSEYVKKLTKSGETLSDKISLRSYMGIFKFYTKALDNPANELNSLNIKVCVAELGRYGAMIKAYE